MCSGLPSNRWAFYQTKDPYFDYAEVLLQIAIVMGAVSIMSKSRPPFYVSLSRLVGAVLVNGYAALPPAVLWRGGRRRPPGVSAMAFVTPRSGSGGGCRN
jgi:hypothetical protein